MNNRPTISSLMDEQKGQGVKLASVAAEVEGVKAAVNGINGRLDRIDHENRQSFDRVYDKLDKATTPRPTPWNAILTAAGVLVAFLAALAGGMLTLIIALAAWGNAYFSGMIDAVRSDHARRLDQLERHADYRRDEKQ